MPTETKNCQFSSKLTRIEPNTAATMAHVYTYPYVSYVNYLFPYLSPPYIWCRSLPNSEGGVKYPPLKTGL